MHSKYSAKWSYEDNVLLKNLITEQFVFFKKWDIYTCTQKFWKGTDQSVSSNYLWGGMESK